MEGDLALKPTLHRALNPVEIAFLTFSALSPAMSVFIYGDGILHMAGTGAAAAVLLGGLIAAVAVFLYAELGAAFPQAGGVYPSLVGVLGPFWAFPYITMMMVLAPTLVAFSLLGFADYVRVLAPGLPEIPVALACLVAAGGVAVLSVRTGAIVTGIFLMIEAASLVALTVVAMTHPARSLATVLAHPTVLDHGLLTVLAPATLGLAVVSGVFTCSGGSWAMYFGEELKDAPRRIGPVIVWVGLLAAVIIAGPLVLVVLSIGDLKQTLGADAPVAAYIAHAAGPGLAAAMSAGLVIAIFNAIVATIMGYARLFYATGRDGVWPGPVNRLLAHIHPGTQSPVRATLILCLWAAAMMLLGEQLLLIACASENIFEYLLMAAAVLVGRRVGACGAGFRAPLHPFIPVFALVVTAGLVVAEWMDRAAGRPSLILLSVLFVASLVYYRFRMARGSGGWATVRGEVVDLT